jgi:hypothetical protein
MINTSNSYENPQFAGEIQQIPKLPTQSEKNSDTQATSSDSTNSRTISSKSEFDALIELNQHVEKQLGMTGSYSLATNQGQIEVNLDEYFSNNTPELTLRLEDIPLILPNAENVGALSHHLSDRMESIFSQNGIPYPPEEIRFDDQGKLQLPEDYPYAEQLESGLDENDGIMRELRTLSAISNHHHAIQDVMEFQQEYANASNPEQIKQVVDKYRYLFDDNRLFDPTVLEFTNNGQIQV